MKQYQKVTLVESGATWSNWEKQYLIFFFRKKKLFFSRKKKWKIYSQGITRKKKIISAIPNVNSIALKLKETS